MSERTQVGVNIKWEQSWLSGGSQGLATASALLRRLSCLSDTVLLEIGSQEAREDRSKA